MANGRAIGLFWHRARFRNIKIWNSVTISLREGVVFLITRRKQFGPATFLWDVQAPDVARAARPGHFVMARIDEHGERIPLTLADFNARPSGVTVVIQAGGQNNPQKMGPRGRDALLHFLRPPRPP